MLNSNKKHRKTQNLPFLGLAKQIRIESEDLLQTQVEEITAEVKHGDRRQYFVVGCTTFQGSCIKSGLK